MRRHINKTFVSYLLSYLIAMIIPAAILGFISQEFFLSYFTENLKENKINTLVNIKNSLDMQIAQLHTNANQIAGRREFTNQYQQRSFSQFYDACSSLASIRYSNDFLSDLQVINTDLGYIYTPATRFTLDAYADFGPSWLSYSNDEVQELLSSLTGTTWMPVQSIRGESRALTYIFPIVRKGELVTTAAIFLISESSLRKISGFSLASENSQFLIADRFNHVLYSSTGEPTPTGDAFWEKLSGSSGTSPVHMSLEHGEAIVYRFFSENSDLQYISIIDYEEIISPIRNLQFIFLIGLLGVFCLGGGAITLFMKRNYGPIRSLSRISKAVLPSIQDNLNDLETVELAMTTMVQHTRDTQDQNDRRIRETLLLNLLRNHIGSLEEFTTQCQSMDIFLEGPYFRVAVLTYEHGEGEPALYDKVALFMKSAFSVEAGLYTLDYAEDNSIILLFSGEKREISGLDAILGELTDGLRVLIPSCQIGLSAVYQSVEQSSQAYRQAVATRYYQPNPPVAVINYKQQSAGELNAIYPSSNINALYNAILSGDTSRIEFAIDMLLPYFSNMGSAFFVMCLGYDIINTALKAMRALDYPYFEFSKKYPELLLKTSFRSTEEIVDVIKMLSIEICAHVKHPTSEAEPADQQADPIDNIHTILVFIKENYTDQNFSAKVLADHFHMSISNLSHYFKKRTGEVVSAHISALRYEHAKKLLRTSDLPITEIAGQSGYCHVSTFIRQFKAQENMTPNTYRNQFRLVSGDSPEEPPTEQD